MKEFVMDNPHYKTYIWYKTTTEEEKELVEKLKKA